MKKKLILLLLFLLIAVPSTTDQAAKKVKLSSKKISLVKGQKKTIKLQNTKTKPTWSVKNKKIVSVRKAGKYSAVVTAKKKGSTFVYAKVKGKKYKCKVTVQTSDSNSPSTEEENPTPENTTTTPSEETAAVDAGEYSIGQIHTGDGTYYDGGYTGGCAKLDAIAGAYYVAAINKIDYRAGCLAGAYLKVTGPSGKSVNVLITDTLADGEGQKGDIDLNQKAFEQIEPLATGRMKVTWQILPLPTDQPIQYVYEPTSTQYWMQVQVQNHRYPVKKLEIQKADGSWQELPREEYNYFTLNQPGTGPYTFRVTDIYGHVLTDTNIPLSTASAVNGAANFPY